MPTDEDAGYYLSRNRASVAMSDAGKEAGVRRRSADRLLTKSRT
jgi:hypothetical protein